MTTKEIKDSRIDAGYGDDGGSIIFWLHEIALQLAIGNDLERARSERLDATSKRLVEKFDTPPLEDAIADLRFKIGKHYGTNELLKDPSESAPPGCFCKPGLCEAPVIMGRQSTCRDPEKAKAKPKVTG